MFRRRRLLFFAGGYYWELSAPFWWRWASLVGLADSLAARLDAGEDVIPLPAGVWLLCRAKV